LPLTVPFPLPIAAFLLGVLIATTACAADDVPPAPKPACMAPEHRQFDFWLGDWEVRDPAGKVVGHNRLTSLHKGCVMFENWTGAGGFTGSSLNIFDADRKKWHQTWTDSSGGLLQIEGGWADGRMVLAGETADPEKPGGTIINRITWQPLPDGRVRQFWEISVDKGAAWKAAFDGYYSKQK
jgi:hypothetical protein